MSGQRPQLVTNNTACSGLPREDQLGVWRLLEWGRSCVLVHVSLVWPHHFKADVSNGFHVKRNPRKALAVCTASPWHGSSGAAENALVGSHS